jgi:hypothetical protein
VRTKLLQTAGQDNSGISFCRRGVRDSQTSFDRSSSGPACPTYHRHLCKSLSREKHESSVRALESALLVRSGAAAAHVRLSAVGSCTLQNRTSSRRRSPRPRNHLHTRCRPASASTASSACWARAAWVRSTRPKRTSPRRSVYLKVIKAAWANRPQRYNQAHQRYRRDNEPLDRRHCNRPLKQPKIEDLP